MVGLGALRFLKVHNAENQVASLQSQINGLELQIPKYDKVQQEHSLILDLAAISNPIVNQRGLLARRPRPCAIHPEWRQHSHLLRQRRSAPAATAGTAPPARQRHGPPAADPDRNGEHLLAVVVRLHLLPQLVLLRSMAPAS